MHQLSFPAFAAAQQASDLPVRFEDPLRLQSTRMLGDVRWDYFDHEVDRGYSLDRPKHIATGSHEAVKLDHCIYVSCTRMEPGL